MFFQGCPWALFWFTTLATEKKQTTTITDSFHSSPLIARWESSFITLENSRLDFKQEITQKKTSNKSSKVNDFKKIFSNPPSQPPPTHQPFYISSHQPQSQQNPTDAHLKLCGFRHHFLTCKVQEVWHIATSDGDLVGHTTVNDRVGFPPDGRDVGPTFSWPVNLPAYKVPPWQIKP